MKALKTINPFFALLIICVVACVVLYVTGDTSEFIDNGTLNGSVINQY